MSSFCITKIELQALVSALRMPITYISMDLPQLTESEESRVVEQLCSQGILFHDTNGFIPTKGLKKHLFPIKSSSDILLFNYGTNNSCIFNASIYFSKNGVVAVYEKTKSSIICICLESLDDILTFIPLIGDGDNSHENEYVSYFHFSDRGYSIAHFAAFNPITSRVIIEEKKQCSNSPLLESLQEASIKEYSEMLKEKLEDVYNVSCG